MSDSLARRRLLPWIVLGVLLVLSLACGGLVLHWLRGWLRTLAAEQDRTQCARRLEQLALALETYDTLNKSYPPAVAQDALGRPQHSWRALLLPHLDNESKDDNLAQRYDFNQAWDGPQNSKLASQMPAAYGCPCDPAGWDSHTSYVGVVDPQTGQLGFRPSGWQAAAVPAAAKILIIELPESGIPWLAPRDLVPGTVEAAMLLDRPYTFSHYGGTHVLLDDGTTRLLKGDELKLLLKALR